MHTNELDRVKFECVSLWTKHPLPSNSKTHPFNYAQKHCLQCIVKSIHEKSLSHFAWLISIARDVLLVKQLLIYYEWRDRNMNMEIGIHLFCKDWIEGLLILFQTPSCIHPHQFSKLVWLACLYPENSIMKCIRYSKLFDFVTEFMQGMAYHILCITGYYADWLDLYNRFYRPHWWSIEECLSSMLSTMYLTNEQTYTIRTAWDIDKLCKHCTEEALQLCFLRREEFVHKAKNLLSSVDGKIEVSKENKNCIPTKRELNQHAEYLIGLP